MSDRADTKTSTSAADWADADLDGDQAGDVDYTGLADMGGEPAPDGPDAATEPDPPGELDEEPDGDELYYGSVDEFVREYLISTYLNRTGLVGVSIVWKRGWTHAEGHHRGEADHASLQPR